MEIQKYLNRAGQIIKSSLQTVWNGAKQVWKVIRFNVKRVWGSFRALFETDEGQPEQKEEERRRAVTSAVKALLGDTPLQALCDCNEKERVDILVSLVEKVSASLNIDTPEIVIKDMDKSLSGLFCFQTNQLIINRSQITCCPMEMDDAAELLDTFLHEIYHAFQHEALLSPHEYGITRETARTWMKNFSNYISSEQNPYLYWQQPVEVTARLFAHAIVVEL